MICPLCSSPSTIWTQDKVRSYFKCTNCDLVHVDRASILSSIDEKKRYDHHQNSESDSSYRDYLNTIAQALLPFIKKEEVGMDFGCGKTQTLAALFSESSIKMDSYDLYFLPNEEIWKKKYDFIILSEVIEHLRLPAETMKKLKSILSHEGKIFIKTKLYPTDLKTFENWFYKRDLTHVQFFNENSFNWLATSLSLQKAEKIGEDLFYFKG